ncbi:unnamed protein product [Victoria cruziana]
MPRCYQEGPQSSARLNFHEFFRSCNKGDKFGRVFDSKLINKGSFNGIIIGFYFPEFFRSCNKCDKFGRVFDSKLIYKGSFRSLPHHYLLHPQLSPGASIHLNP